MDLDEIKLRGKLDSPEIYKNVDLQNIPLGAFGIKKKSEKKKLIVNLDTKIDQLSDEIIETLATIKEIAFDKTNDEKKQYMEYISSLIYQFEDFEKNLVEQTLCLNIWNPIRQALHEKHQELREELDDFKTYYVDTTHKTPEQIQKMQLVNIICNHL